MTIRLPYTAAAFVYSSAVISAYSAKKRMVAINSAADSIVKDTNTNADVISWKDKPFLTYVFLAPDDVWLANTYFSDDLPKSDTRTVQSNPIAIKWRATPDIIEDSEYEIGQGNFLHLVRHMVVQTGKSKRIGNKSPPRKITAVKADLPPQIKELMNHCEFKDSQSMDDLPM